ncbi:class I SAM-dependent methyltransferase [Candidatus Nomurabacteria bacterium]|nr:class I SAM-dependent methyltransferase [Candidatus Nomurabacteria bacterium]
MLEKDNNSIWNKLFEKKVVINKSSVFINNFLKDKKPGKLLDLGCGAGRNIRTAIENNMKVSAIDSSDIALKILQKQLENDNVNIINADIKRLPFETKSFDYIIATRTLHHGVLEDITQYFKELERVLKCDGEIAINLLSDSDIRINTGEEIEKNTRINIQNTFDPQIPHHFFSKTEILEYLANFNILDIYERDSLLSSEEKYGSIIYWYIIAKKQC